MAILISGSAKVRAIKSTAVYRLKTPRNYLESTKTMCNENYIYYKSIKGTFDSMSNVLLMLLYVMKVSHNGTLESYIHVLIHIYS